MNSTLPHACRCAVSPTVASPIAAELHGQRQSQTEWWHYTGHLRSGDRQFGFQLTFFRYRTKGIYVGGFSPVWPIARSIHFAHFALTDITSNQFRYAHRRSFNFKAGAKRDRYFVWLGDWNVHQSQGCHVLKARMQGVELELCLNPVKPGVRHGRNGKFHRGGNQISNHLSFPRMKAEGGVRVDGQSHAVTGTAWMDREFGDFDFCPQMGGWDWFALQLDDGRELMVYQVCNEHRRYNGHRSLSLIDPDASVRQFSGNDFSVRALGTWTSPQTGTTYPFGWEVDVPVLEARWQVIPVLDCQELDTRGTTCIIYCEKAARVKGHFGGQASNGNAYVELVGYNTTHRRIRQPFVGYWDVLRNELRFWGTGAQHSVSGQTSVEHLIGGGEKDR